jgi:hypothetical protein
MSNKPVHILRFTLFPKGLLKKLNIEEIEPIIGIAKLAEDYEDEEEIVMVRIDAHLYHELDRLNKKYEPEISWTQANTDEEDDLGTYGSPNISLETIRMIDQEIRNMDDNYEDPF